MEETIYKVLLDSLKPVSDSAGGSYIALKYSHELRMQKDNDVCVEASFLAEKIVKALKDDEGVKPESFDDLEVGACYAVEKEGFNLYWEVVRDSMIYNKKYLIYHREDDKGVITEDNFGFSSKLYKVDVSQLKW